MKKLLAGYSMKDMMLIAVMAALGVALKPIVVPIANTLASPLLIPGGAFAGGLYMMWLVMASALTGRVGAAALAGLVQALLMMVTGMPGSHGVLSFITYILPGVFVDVAALLFLRRGFCLNQAFIAGIAANLTGTVLSNLIFIRPPLIPWLLSLTVAAFSGGVGGLIAWRLYGLLQKYHLGGPADEEE